MIQVVSKQTMISLDKHMIENMKIPSILLMENAAFGITTAVREKFRRQRNRSMPDPFRRANRVSDSEPARPARSRGSS